MQITSNVTNLQERDFNISNAMMYTFFTNLTMEMFSVFWYKENFLIFVLTANWSDLTFISSQSFHRRIYMKQNTSTRFIENLNVFMP